ncbi:hypothetical protein SESI111939_19990 [Serratia silvae]
MPVTQFLSGRVAFVQGGSRGIGAAIVKRLARECALKQKSPKKGLFVLNLKTIRTEYRRQSPLAVRCWPLVRCFALGEPAAVDHR